MAKALAAEHYRNDREAELSPVDLALGWGPCLNRRIWTNSQPHNLGVGIIGALMIFQYPEEK